MVKCMVISLRLFQHGMVSILTKVTGACAINRSYLLQNQNSSASEPRRWMREANIGYARNLRFVNRPAGFGKAQIAGPRSWFQTFYQQSS